MTFRRSFLVPAVIVVGVAGALGSCATVPQRSGIRGHTNVDGGCPVIIESTSCRDIPLPARISIKDSRGTTVAETSSNDQGEFRMDLPPGPYEVRAVNLTGAPLPSALPEHVVVGTGTFTDVIVTFDSGVR